MTPSVSAAVSNLDGFGGKVAVALVGVVAGWLIKTVWDLYAIHLRWRRLTPLVLNQISAAAALGIRSFDARALRRIEQRLVAAQIAATEMVASGVGKADWPTALSHIADCLDDVQSATDATPSELRVTLELLRTHSGSLQKWSEVQALAR